MSAEPRKRSRFDQTEPEPPRRSRFDRRSRSPAGRASESRRSKSPASGAGASPAGEKPRLDPAAAAAAAAARINAQIQAKKGAQHVDVTPVRATSTPAKSPGPGSAVIGEVYQQDGDYIKDIEVNDLRNRYTLTKGATQKMIKEETGADVTTRGNYYPDKAMATAAAPPLYLHVTSITKEGLEKAIEKIQELMQQDLPNLIDERRFRRREPEQVERDELGRRKWPEERIPIDLEPIPGFNLRAQVVGHGGAYVKHIQGETRCRVQIKGRGSGFMEQNTGQESDEPMYLHVAGPDANEVKRARELCEDLLGNVKEQYQQFKERGPRGGNRFGGGDYGNGGYGQQDNRGGYDNRSGNYDNRGGGHDNRSGGYDNRSAGGYGHGQGQTNSPYSAQQAASAMSPGVGTPGAGADPNAELAAQYAAYYAANPDQDPYAAYGGYQAYAAYYAYYQQQAQAGGAVDPTGADVGSAAAPPPPPNDQPPPPPGMSSQPPPPPSGPPPGGYSSVPPPPGI